jgi:type I restriction enzyme M protein
MLQKNAALRSKIDELWKKFWAGGISNPLSAIEQITFLLFMKRMDRLDSEQQENADFMGEEFQSRFEGEPWVPAEYKDKPEEAAKHAVPRDTLRWKTFSRYKADVMLPHVRDKVFPFLKDLNGNESKFTHHMKNAVFIIPKPSLLVDAVKTIDEIFIEMEKDAKDGKQNFQDIQGDVYEYLLSEIASAGKNGQFRTPRHIIKLVTELVNPQLGECHFIADPACGSSGFLLGAYQHIITELAKVDGAPLHVDEDGFTRAKASHSFTEERKQILGNNLYGYDIDQSMVRMGLMNLMMHGVDEPNVDYQDTLSKSFNEEGKYQYILANPPFTGNIDKGDINESLTIGSTKTELLFIENIYRMLKKGGTAGVIIPQGVLFGTGKAFINTRKIITERCQLKAVVSLPSGVFKPYAGVATAILLFTKVYDNEETIDKIPTKETFFYDMESDGYSLDDRRTKNENNHGDLQDMLINYRNTAKNNQIIRSNKYFIVSFDEIKKESYDLTFSRYKKDDFKAIEYEEPIEILKKLIIDEVGNDFDLSNASKLKGGIIKELIELKGIIE